MFEIENEKYLHLLAEKYPTEQAVCREIINLKAILNLPKGTEHFMSDFHGEYEAFCHIYNNCSGVIREKINVVFGELLSKTEKAELCTLIYYPEAKLGRIKTESHDTFGWYRETLQRLIAIAKFLSAKYTRSKVRKALPVDFGYIIDELIHAQPDEDNNQVIYHNKILETIIQIDNADEFIYTLSALIKRLAVDHLHIVGDIFDRGQNPDKIMDILIDYHSLDIEWGNHDILWMGAAAGSDACIATVIRNNLSHDVINVLESGYGLSLRSLTLFAERTYKYCDNPIKIALQAISVILFKLEGQIILRQPDYDMNSRLLLDKIDLRSKTISIDGETYLLNTDDFPTIDLKHPYELSDDEEKLVAELRSAFKNSERLQRHIKFLYSNGSMYNCYNNNLLFHGCIPLDKNGNFQKIQLNGNVYRGKSYMDYSEQIARRAYFSNENQNDLDFMWYLWCGKSSPLSGRTLKTFERTFIDDTSAWEEQKNPYYTFCHTAETCSMILRDFGLFSPISHIINGHTPIKVSQGESPIKADGKLIVIDGGFCKAYQKTTGIAGYTLIYNSHGMRIKSHRPFESVEAVLSQNKDISSESVMFETSPHRIMISNTDQGIKLQILIEDLNSLLKYYRKTN